MRILLIITILLISDSCFSQLKSTIIDSETKEKIPYVNIWVENENIGTTSNEKGEFELEIDSTKIIIFSAIGFETRKIVSDSIKNVLALKPLITELKEVVVKSKKDNKELVVGKFKKSKINSYFATTGKTPWISARYFKFQENYYKTSFLKKIRVLTNSDVENSKFNIRFYSISDNGEPKDYIFDDNIIGIAKKGKKITEIDISGLNIEFPKSGFFIAIEWLIIKSNKHQYSYTIEGSKKKLTGINYEPKIGTVPTDSDENSWIHNQGKWKKIFKNRSVGLKKYKDKYNLLAIELTLTN